VKYPGDWARSSDITFLRELPLLQKAVDRKTCGETWWSTRKYSAMNILVMLLTRLLKAC
jgi:hypothetical protein